MLNMLLLLIPLLFPINRQQIVTEPNILIIVLDDVGYVDLQDASAAGATPTLDWLALNGRTFVNAYGNPLCSPTRRCIYFGKWHTGPLIPTCTGSGGEPPSALQSLAELRLNRPCGTFGKWHLGGDPDGVTPWQYAPMIHGFDKFGAGHASNVGECNSSDYNNWERVDDGVITPSTLYEPIEVADSFISWVNAQGGTWLAVVNANLAHSPGHQPPTSLIPASFVQPTGTRGQYLAMISAYDTLIGIMLAAVDMTKTRVIVIGDNGTPSWAMPGGLSQGGGKGTVFERGIHIPLIVAGPGVSKGSVSTALVHAIDVHATVGDDWNVSNGADGQSLTHNAGHDFILCGDAQDVCVRSLQYKLTRNLGTGVEKFYVEPDETHNKLNDPLYSAEVIAHRTWLDTNL